MTDRFQSLESQISEIRKPAPLDPAERAKQFFDDPDTATRGIVRTELDEAIKPLKSFVSEFKGASDYEKAKTRVKNIPQFKPVFDAAEDLIDSAMQGQTPNDQVIQAVALSVAGSLQMGLIPGRTLAAAPAPPLVPGAPVQPSHIRPSAPPPPAPPTPKEPELTELERRLAREKGLSPKQYIALRDMKPSEVATTKISEIK